MRFSRYCKDKWVSIVIFGIVFWGGGSLLWLIDIPFAVSCVVEGIYVVGFFFILVQDYLTRREFYDKLLEATENLDEICYLSEFLKQPHFQEGQILYQVLKKDEKYMNDRIASREWELQDYKNYVETWVHEIKTPIAVSRIIMENNRNEVMESLTTEMDKLEQFVEQMLYYSKSSSLQDDYRIRPVSLKAIVMESVKSQARYMIAEQVMLKFEELDYTVLTDSKWMRFILNQIISNGIKYHAKERKPEIIFSAVRDGRKIILCIKDNGIGIPEEDVGRVMRKGFTGENGRKYSKSTGMGLYICDTLCRKLGTEFAIASKEGEGTVVSICMMAESEEIG